MGVALALARNGTAEQAREAAKAAAADAAEPYAALSSGFPYGGSNAASNYFSGAGSFGAFGGGGGGDDGDGAPPSEVNAGWKPPGPPPRTLPVNGGRAGGSK